MSEKLIHLTNYDHVKCDLCGTNYDCSPQGMYEYVKLDSDGILISNRIVCAICVLYSKKHIFDRIQKE